MVDKAVIDKWAAGLDRQFRRMVLGTGEFTPDPVLDERMRRRGFGWNPFLREWAKVGVSTHTWKWPDYVHLEKNNVE